MAFSKKKNKKINQHFVCKSTPNPIYMATARCWPANRPILFHIYAAAAGRAPSSSIGKNLDK